MKTTWNVRAKILWEYLNKLRVITYDPSFLTMLHVLGGTSDEDVLTITAGNGILTVEREGAVVSFPLRKGTKLMEVFDGGKQYA